MASHRASSRTSHRPVAASSIPLPEDFLEDMRAQIGEEETARLAAALDGEPVSAIRINRRKVADPAMVLSGFEGVEATPVEWCASGYLLSPRPDFNHDPLLHAGAYYVQEPASMYYETLLYSYLPSLLPSLSSSSSPVPRPSSLSVLDLCAAPGGKTTAMLNALLSVDYRLTANEIDRKRVRILQENIDKWGDLRVTVTSQSAAEFGKREDSYDVIAVDAPCSGEGMMRREPQARRQWSRRLVEQCAVLQREIVSDVLPALKPGGILIYSTCTFNRKENEDNIDWMVNELGLTLLAPPRRFMPHSSPCEGLCVAVLQRNEGRGTRDEVSERGVGRGTRDEVSPLTDPVPATSLAPRPSSLVPLKSLVPLTKEEALRFLRGEALKFDESVPLGIITVGYMGLPLGTMKNIGTRANNLYPKHLRLK